MAGNDSTLSQNCSKCVNKNEAYHGWSRCNGIWASMVSVPDIQYSTWPKAGHTHFVASAPVECADIKTFFGTA